MSRNFILQRIEEIQKERDSLTAINDKYAFLTGWLAAYKELLKQ